MSTNIGGNPALWPVLFPIPSDGDAPDASSVDGAFTALAHRTANLDSRTAKIVAALKNVTVYEKTETISGPITITNVTGTPPGVALVTGAYTTIPALTAVTRVFVEASFDLTQEYVSGIARDVTCNLGARPSAGGTIVPLGAYSHVQPPAGTAGGTLRQRVHIMTEYLTDVTNPETDIYLMAGKASSAIAAVENIKIRVMCFQEFSL